MPSAPGALAGGPTQAAPGVRGEEEQWAREIGAQLRRMADDLNALYERRVSAGGGADGRWDFPLGRGLRRPSQMCGSCCPARRGRAGDRQLGGAAWSPSRRRRARGAVLMMDLCIKSRRIIDETLMKVRGKSRESFAVRSYLN